MHFKAPNVISYVLPTLRQALKHDHMLQGIISTGFKERTDKGITDVITGRQLCKVKRFKQAGKLRIIIAVLDTLTEQIKTVLDRTNVFKLYRTKSNNISTGGCNRVHFVLFFLLTG